MSNRKINDPFGGDYMGNLFGKKFTIIAAVVIVLLGALIAYRHITLGVPFGMQEVEPEPADTLQDTLMLNED